MAAKAGSGIGASIVGVAIIVTVLLLMARRSRRRRSDTEATTAEGGVVYVKRQWIRELDAKMLVELDSKVQVELPGSDGRLEFA